ncbi:MAG: hypothetical protein U9R41_02635 [Candidatus Marinimicrobia bacterium]|nr:hypothetical protein [Candidatus Neomarinimicrobiota bacterium]
MNLLIYLIVFLILIIYTFLFVKASFSAKKIIFLYSFLGIGLSYYLPGSKTIWQNFPLLLLVYLLFELIFIIKRKITIPPYYKIIFIIFLALYVISAILSGLNIIVPIYRLKEYLIIPLCLLFVFALTKNELKEMLFHTVILIIINSFIAVIQKFVFGVWGDYVTGFIAGQRGSGYLAAISSIIVLFYFSLLLNKKIKLSKFIVMLIVLSLIPLLASARFYFLYLPFALYVMNTVYGKNPIQKVAVGFFIVILLGGFIYVNDTYLTHGKILPYITDYGKTYDYAYGDTGEGEGSTKRLYQFTTAIKNNSESFVKVMFGYGPGAYAASDYLINSGISTPFTKSYKKRDYESYTTTLGIFLSELGILGLVVIVLFSFSFYFIALRHNSLILRQYSLGISIIFLANMVYFSFHSGIILMLVSFMFFRIFYFKEKELISDPLVFYNNVKRSRYVKR